MTEVACAIIQRGDEILITQRSEKMSHPLEWEFPGGKLLPGESPEKCLQREIYEELNLNIRVEQLLPSIIHQYEAQKIKLIPFICTIVSGEMRLVEHRSIKWIRKEDLKDLTLLDADMKILESLYGRRK